LRCPFRRGERVRRNLRVGHGRGTIGLGCMKISPDRWSSPGAKSNGGQAEMKFHERRGTHHEPGRSESVPHRGVATSIPGRGRRTGAGTIDPKVEHGLHGHCGDRHRRGTDPTDGR
jgi:hypothetical protein